MRWRGSIGRWRMADASALLALALDAAIGWPEPVYRRIGHPVAWLGSVIDRAERQWNAATRPDRARRMGGIATMLILLLVAGGSGLILQRLLAEALGNWSWLGIALLAAPGLAQRSLYDHVHAVETALRGGRIIAARRAVGMLVGRDTDALGEADIARAAIESLAESFCDGVVAPLFWLLLLGLPGLWAYKAINTADSMIGHMEPRWRAFGWAAARTDDLANLVPARLAGAILCLSGGGWRTMWRDAALHASPNSGWPEAAMAGGLGLKLAGPVAYDGVVHDKPWIGEGVRAAGANDIRRALHVFIRGCLCLWAVAAVGVLPWR